MEQFVETKRRFEEALGGYSFPMSYDAWVHVPDALKAAALYVNFYEQMTLAWYKAKSEWVPDTDGISVLMQYIIKNVPEILASKGRRYTANYMYKVAYNCMSCLRRVDRDKQSFEGCIQYASVDGEEIDIFATIPINDGIMEYFENTKIWAIISRLTDIQKDAVDRLINVGAVSKSMLRKYPDIMDQLRDQFKDFDPTAKNVQAVIRFADVYNHDDVSSAVVIMRDGVKAVYYGEQRVSHSGSVDVIFYGPTHDYIIPLDFARDLVVDDVEYISD